MSSHYIDCHCLRSYLLLLILFFQLACACQLNFLRFRLIFFPSAIQTRTNLIVFYFLLLNFLCDSEDFSFYMLKEKFRKNVLVLFTILIDFVASFSILIKIDSLYVFFANRHSFPSFFKR